MREYDEGGLRCGIYRKEEEFARRRGLWDFLIIVTVGFKLLSESESLGCFGRGRYDATRF